MQISAEMNVSEGVYGWGLGSFFLAATVGSILLGRLAQRLGPLNQITLALVVTACVQLAIATTAQSFQAIIAFLLVAGFANAANQTAVNLALGQARLRRLGFAVSIKQSGMPTAALLSGFAVPVLALTVGWRWAYVSGAALALTSADLVRKLVSSARLPTTKTAAMPASSRGSLVLAAVVGGLLAFSAGSLNAWVVSSGVDAGLSAGIAGLFLGVGASCGVLLRLLCGLRSDAMRVPPMKAAGITGLLGSLGIALLGSRLAGVHVAATLLALGGGWIWPVFTNFGIVRANPDSAGAATGITQMGVYVGVFVGPLTTGALIERFNYQVMWFVVAASAMVGAIIAIRISDRF